jgi:hypothetical protein
MENEWKIFLRPKITQKLLPPRHPHGLMTLGATKSLPMTPYTFKKPKGSDYGNRSD